MKKSRLASTEMPATVTPIDGTKSGSTRRRSANENASVAMSTASTALRARSRYHRRMYRGENVSIAIWTTSTVTVTTKPVSAAIAPMIAASTVLAVDGEYCQACGSETDSSTRGSSNPSTAPSTPPMNGTSQMLPFRYCLIRKRVLHVISPESLRRPDRGHRPERMKQRGVSPGVDDAVETCTAQGVELGGTDPETTLRPRRDRSMV